EVAQQIALGPGLDGVPGAAPSAAGVLTGPEREAFVVFRGQHDVTRARFAEGLGPLIGVEQLGAEHRGELRVIEIRTVDALMEFPCGTTRRTLGKRLALSDRI